MTSTELTLISGSYKALSTPKPPPSSWAAQPGADVTIWTLRMDPGAEFTLPAAKSGTNRALYFFAVRL